MTLFRFLCPAVLFLLALLSVSCRGSVPPAPDSDVPSDLVTVDIWLEVDSALTVSGPLSVHFAATDSSGVSYVVIFDAIGPDRYRAVLPPYVSRGGGQLVVSHAGKSCFFPLSSQTWQSGQVYLYSLLLTPDGLFFRQPLVPGASDGWEHHYQTDVVFG